MEICGFFNPTRLVVILVGIMLVACQTSGPADDLAMKVDDFHQDMSEMVNSYSYAESAISDGACIWVSDLNEETYVLPRTGAPASLVRQAASELALACRRFEKAVQDKEDWMSAARQNLDPRRLTALERALNNDRLWTAQETATAIELLTFEETAWTNRTFHARQLLNASCKSLADYKMVRGSEQSIGCGTFTW